MDSVTLLAQAQAAGLTVYAEGDRLVVRGPRSAEPLAKTLLAHKAELMPWLTAPQTSAREPVCPVCGALDWRDTPDGGRWCVPCVLVGRTLVSAVKVRSAALETEIWVVAYDLPREAWPTDGATVYTQEEVKLLVQVGTDTLAWVHATKTMFGGNVVQGHRKGEPHG